jgi:hypothetical protein
MDKFTFEFGLRNNEYCAIFANGTAIGVLTKKEVEKLPAKKVAAMFAKVTGWPEQRPDGYVMWSDIGRARLLLGLVPRPLKYS